ncbi:DUF1318 domain-containing protein [bacterium]|nr:DUF1318 domain-containing protein [bacterium]
MKNLGLLFCATIGLALYCACTPEVKITGDAEKPIAINAEINIHIYQHAEEVVDDLYAGLDDEPEPEPDSAFVRIMERVLASVSISSCEAAEQKSQAYQEMKKLFAETYTKYMKTGYVGENKDGYVTYVGKPEKCDPKVAAAAQEAVRKLNAARKAFYEEEAKSQNTTVSEIQKTYAAVYAAKAKGIWVEVSNGKTYEWKKF